MGMAKDQLVGNCRRAVGEIEHSGLVRHLRVKDHLQQQVAQFARQFGPGLPVYGIRDLVRFLDRVGRDGCEILFDIPGAAGPGVAQLRHDVDQAGDLGAGVAARVFGHCDFPSLLS